MLHEDKARELIKREQAKEKAKRHMIGLAHALYEWGYGKPPQDRWWQATQLVICQLVDGVKIPN